VSFPSGLILAYDNGDVLLPKWFEGDPPPFLGKPCISCVASDGVLGWKLWAKYRGENRRAFTLNL